MPFANSALINIYRSTFTPADQSATMISSLPHMSCKKRKRTLEKLDLPSSLSSSQSDPLSPFLLSPTFLHATEPISTYPFHNSTPSSSLSTPKRRRIPLHSKSHFRQQSTPTISSTTSASYPPNLAPCHICHRRPTAHADLPGYSSCETCERRTCYICIRVCESEGCRSNSVSGNSGAENETEYRQVLREQHGQNHARDGTGHTVSERSPTRGKSVCSKCCVEVGAEGKVWCFVCFEDDADEHDRGSRDSGDEEPEDETGRVEEWLDSFDEGQEDRSRN